MDSENNETTQSTCELAKNVEYASSSQQLPKINSSGPFLGFEDEEAASETPPRSRIYAALDLDSRFFPDGLQPGSIVEVKGPENCGKTYLLTYFVVQMLVKFPTKKAVFINTSHQFSMRNLIGMLLREILGKEISDADKCLPLPKIMKQTPELATYLDRLIVLNCFSVEEFVLTVAFDDCSVLTKLAKKDRKISLVVVDTIDSYSFTDSLDRDNPLDILASLKKNCERIPTICSTIGIFGNFQLLKNALPVDPPLEMPYFSNITIGTVNFTHTMSIVPATKAEIDAIPKLRESKNPHCANAYLRSKQRANMAGSADIHRVKFSIFSDMLWVLG